MVPPAVVILPDSSASPGVAVAGALAEARAIVVDTVVAAEDPEPGLAYGLPASARALARYHRETGLSAASLLGHLEVFHLHLAPAV